MPFGYGPRICGGQNLAHMTIRLLIVALVRNYDISPAEGTNAEAMSQRFNFVRRVSAVVPCLRVPDTLSWQVARPSAKTVPMYFKYRAE